MLSLGDRECPLVQSADNSTSTRVLLVGERSAAQPVQRKELLSTEWYSRDDGRSE